MEGKWEPMDGGQERNTKNQGIVEGFEWREQEKGQTRKKLLY